MLLRFRVENFRSLKGKQELSLIASKLGDTADGLLEFPGVDVAVLPVAAVYGANASGKSSVLLAMSYMHDAVIQSHRRWSPEGGVPREPFTLDLESRLTPSTFEVDLLLDGTRYEYGFAVDSERVVGEWLVAFPSGRPQKWFTRDVNAKQEYRFSRELAGENSAIRKLTRSNSLYLSAAAQNNHAMLRPIYDWFARSLIVVADRERELLSMQTVKLMEKSEFRSGVVRLLGLADVGVSGVDVSLEELPPEALRLAQALFPDNSGFQMKLQPDFRIPRIKLQHTTTSGHESEIAFEEESRGTQALFGLAGPILLALSEGSTLLVDELDTSLHPLLAIEIVKMFGRRETNPRNAQLVFNTHDTNILECGLLRRDQVWFTEKNEDGETQLYPLTDFRARKEENLERGYLQGRYGAVPFLSGAEGLIGGLIAG
ncbi:MAG: ATP-binding protein [Gemmatimonadaceae bacterium]|nr:ATP-binding protein [Gemmatimonadaceae bacterium]